MDNRTLAARLAGRAHALERERASLFRVRAYRRAGGNDPWAWISPSRRLIEQGEPLKVARLASIGRSLSRTIENLLRGLDEAE